MPQHSRERLCSTANQAISLYRRNYKSTLEFRSRHQSACDRELRQPRIKPRPLPWPTISSTACYLRFPFSNDPGARRRPDSASRSARIVSLLFPRSHAAFVLCLRALSLRCRIRPSCLCCASRSLIASGLSISEYSPTGAPAALERLIFSSRSRFHLDLPMCQLRHSTGSMPVMWHTGTEIPTNAWFRIGKL